MIARGATLGVGRILQQSQKRLRPKAFPRADSGIVTRSSRYPIYFTEAEDVLAAAKAGKSIELLVGLNESTSPQALKAVLGVPNIAVRYLTGRFHAKIFIFDDDVLVGSSNLTQGGLFRNREATVRLNPQSDLQRIEDLKAIFAELWEAADALSEHALAAFRLAIESLPKTPGADEQIEKAVGRVEPATVSVESHKKSPRLIFEKALRRDVQQYISAFSEVTWLLEENGLRRAELAKLSPANETNRFLNWVRLSYVHGDEAWQSAELKTEHDRREGILGLGMQWKEAEDDRIPQDYFAWLDTVERTFGTSEAVASGSREEITEGLMSLHAFTEQQRFTKGGSQNLPKAFWNENLQDVERVRHSLAHLIHAPGDFVIRLHDLLYDRRYKLGFFGRFCALELYGTLRPTECPPMNGRMAKALRYLGFDVRGA